MNAAISRSHQVVRAAREEAAVTEPADTYIAFVALVPSVERANSSSEEIRRLFMVACRQVTERVEWVLEGGAFLDLGVCTSAEARNALASLRSRLKRGGVQTHVGIGPSMTLAHLVALIARPDTPLPLVTRAAAGAFLRPISVATLPRLHPQQTVTEQTVEQLQQYGLRTLGHLTRVGEPALRRQFGHAVGTTLAAIARGEDVRPLQPTPRPLCQRVRQRFDSPVSPDQLLATLPMWCDRIAHHLDRQRQQARTLSVWLSWEGGDSQETRQTLRQPTNDPRLLVQETRRLLLPLIQTDTHTVNSAELSAVADDSAAAGTPDAIAELSLSLEEITPVMPEQAAFWRSREQRLATLQALAEALDRRHGRPVVLHAACATPDAIFAEERYAFTKRAKERLAGVKGKTAKSAASDVMPREPLRATSTRQATLPGDTGAGEDPWSAVPHRLHWW